MKFICTILAFIFVNFCVAQNPCKQGNCEFPHMDNHPQDPLDDTSTSGGISADPNEIIGPIGYDSIHWVSINDVLNYTILFENDQEFASANAQRWM